MRARTRVIKREHGGGMVSMSRCKEVSYNERERERESHRGRMRVTVPRGGGE